MGLFVALPLCLGLFSTLIYSYRTPRSHGECLIVSIVPMVLRGAGPLLFAFEGVIFIVMAAPLGLGLSALGGAVGYWIQEGRWRLKGRWTMMGLVLIAPRWMGLEPGIEGQEPLLVVSTD